MERDKSDCIEAIIGPDAKSDSVESDEIDLSEEIKNSTCEKAIGRISLAFIDGDSNEFSEFPSTYYTFSAKERLLLIFAENYRRQFVHEFPHRKPLVLAVPNECEIQKFVSTTIRPSVFLYPELIDDWKGIARFVSDFITYEPLQDPTQLVSAALI